MTTRSKFSALTAAAVLALAAGGVAIAGTEGKAPTPVVPSAGESGDGEAAGTRADAGESPDDDAGEAGEQLGDRSTSERAAAVAVKAAHGVTVTEVERADDGQSGYEVEVRRPGGSHVEVSLDRGFGVVSVDTDDD